MFKNSFKRIIGTLLLVPMLLCSVFLTGCDDGYHGNGDPVEYKVSVKSEGGMPFEKIMLQVYEDPQMTELLWAGETDKEGKATFTAPATEYFLSFKDAPEGYAAEEPYTVSEGDTNITLKAVIKEGGIDEVVFKRGSIIRDFAVTVDGEEYRISSLLEEKKAVVLNFWFLNCGPCRSEFPHMQAAYEKYSDKIELLALNPYDGTESEVADFAKANALTFPMAKCGEEFATAFELTAYPTTVVVDRYGMIAMIEKGAIPDSETFEKIFRYFSADDYTQKIIRNLSDIDK